MGLGSARALAGTLPPLGIGPPYACAALTAWRGLPFDFTPEDPRLLDLDRGGRAFENLKGAARAWREHPAWMDFLDPASPGFARKAVERAIYLRDWEPLVPPGARVLDLGGGIGRFTTWCLDRGCSVELVDADPESLRRAVRHAAGRPGFLDVHWTTVEALPALGTFDVVIACELLCYVESPAAVVSRIVEMLRPGGVLLASVEAENGWVASADAAGGSLESWASGEAVHVAGDRFVRTFDRDAFEALFGRFETLSLRPTHYVSSGPFENAAGSLSAEEALAWEDRLAADPRASAWNRAWTGAFRKR